MDLYQAIGGRTKIKAAVDAFYSKVLADPALGRFFARADMDGLRAKQAMFLTMLLGGEQRYTGRDLGEAHAATRVQGLTHAHFDVLLGHLREALEEIEVAPHVVTQIIQRVESTRSAVLGTEEDPPR
jgi:hemoglobin